MQNKVSKEVCSAINGWILKLANQLSANCTSSKGVSKKSWVTVDQLKKGLNNHSTIRQVNLRKADGSICTSPEENVSTLHEHFKSVYQRKPVVDVSVLDLLPDLACVQSAAHPPTDGEIKLSIKKLHNTAAGNSGIGAEFWKILSTNNETFAVMRNVILEFWTTELPPREWNTGLLNILPKKGDLKDPNNYRGIMLLETFYKIIANILHARLSPIAETIDHEPQCGFRAGRSCADAIFALRLAIKKRKEHNLESWILFVDLVKAFDRVPRHLLWEVLMKFGVPPNPSDSSALSTNTWKYISASLVHASLSIAQ